MGTEMIASNQHLNKIDDYIKKFEVKQKYRGLFKSLAVLSEKPAIKMAKRATKNDENATAKMKANRNHEKLWKDSKIHHIPAMPDNFDEEKAITGTDYRCTYCGDLCDVNNLRCKTCANVYHIECLYNRGHLNSVDITVQDEWSCSDCNDLSKLLTHDDILKLINLFDELDANQDCLIKCNEYIRSKKKLCEEYGQPMSLTEEDAERRHFRLMDTDHSGTITWNEFINYEAPSLLSKKNKVELSTKLSLRELILVKRRFLHFDKLKMGMISKEDAKSVYVEYIHKLRKKLGRAFEEHLLNCDKLLDISNEKLNENHKVTWEEFVRKMTILIIFDRLNAQVYAPQSWKPGNWFKSSFDREIVQFQRQKTLTIYKNLQPRESLIAAAAKKKKKLFKLNSEKFIDTEYLMKNNIDINDYKPFEDNDFGSNLYVIRSTFEKTYNNNFNRTPKKVSMSQHLPPIEYQPSTAAKTADTTTTNTATTPATATTIANTPNTTTTTKNNLNTSSSTRIDIVAPSVQVPNTSTTTKPMNSIRNETPVTINTVTTLSYFTSDKKLIADGRPELPPIQSSAPAIAHTTAQKQYQYDDFIKRMHQTKRFAHTTNTSLKYRKSSFDTSNQMMINKHRTAIPSFDFDSSSSFRNNAVQKNSQIFTRLRRLPELNSTISSSSNNNQNNNNFTSRSSFLSKFSATNKYTQSLDAFYNKNSNKRRKEYMKSNHMIWTNLLSSSNRNNNNNNTHTSYFNQTPKNTFHKTALESSLVF